MIELLKLLVAIIIGAVIGYVTNYIAIKMLFRPYKKYYIFKKIPVPLTPGIIPKHRASIAVRFGGLVGDVFLNEETFKSKIREESTKALISKTVDTYLIQIKESEMDTVEALVPEKHKDKLEKFVAETKKILMEQIRKYLRSSYFSNTVKELVENEYQALINTKVEDLINKENFKKLLEDMIKDISHKEEFIDKILNLMEKYIDGLFEKNVPLEEFLPEGSIEMTLNAFSRMVPVVLPELGNLLDNEDIKSLLTERIKQILYQIISELNAFQKMMVGLIQPKKLIEKEVPELVKKFIAEMKKTLNEKDTADKVDNIIKDYFNELKTKNISEILNSVDKNKYQDVKDKIRISIKEFIQNKNSLTDNLSKIIMNALDSLSDKTIKELLQAYSLDFHDKIEEFLVKKIVEFAQAEKAQETIRNFLDRNIDYAVYKLRIGKINDYLKIDENKQGKVVLFISDVFLNVLEVQTPKIVNALDINKMIKDKMDSFSVQTMEKIIIKVVKSELTYINIFGAILGGLIGSINFVLNILMRIVFG